MDSRRQLAIVLSTMILVAAAPAAINVAIDPYQLLRPKRDGLRTLHDKSRKQAAGLIRSYLADPNAGFDTVVIGTSMGQNFVPSHIREVLGCKGVLKLNMPGSTAPVQLFVARKTLEVPTTRRVLWELSTYYEDASPAEVQHVATFPAFLYGDSLPDLAKSIFNADVLDDSLDQLFDPAAPVAYDDWNRWYEPESWDDWRRKQLVDRLPWIHARVMEQHPVDSSVIVDLMQISTPPEFPMIDQVVEVVSSHPDVEFDFFFPPRSTLDYAASDLMPRLFFLQGYATRQLSRFSNARVHGFDDVEGIVLRLENYKDPGHYHPDVNHHIIESISKRSNELHAANIAAYETRRMELLNHVVGEIQMHAPLSVTRRPGVPH